MDTIFKSLYTKNGFAAKEIAKILIPFEAGSRIPRIDDFAQRLSLGRGTVQGGLRVLEDSQVVELQSKGHLGTYLVQKNEHLLKKIAGVGAYLGAMPLPYSKMYEGLATGMIEVSGPMINRINLAYMRGSKNRIEALKDHRADFVIMSKLAAQEEIKKDSTLQIVQDFGPATYVSSHKIFLANPEYEQITDNMRVGIDYTSTDQAKITLLECEGKDVDLVSINYMQLFEQLLNGTIDAAVWNSDEIRATENLKRIDFSSEKAKQLAVNASTSVIMMEKSRTDIVEYLSSLDIAKVKAIQSQVIHNEKLPHY